MFESMRINTELRKREGWAEIDRDRDEPKQAGWKTILAACLMLLSGLVLFITGSVIYWGHTPEDKHTGLEMLVIGAVCKYNYFSLFYSFSSSLSSICFGLGFNSAFARKLCCHDTVWRLERMAWLPSQSIV
jgi:hypothetical protein